MSVLRKNYRNFSDADLMSLLAKGGQPAFDELYSRYAKQMLNFFYRLLNNDRERAEDLMHDLFLKIIERPEAYDCDRNFRTWLYTLAGNMVKNEYRTRQVRNEHAQTMYQFQADLVEYNKENHDENLFQIKLRSALEKLDPDTRLLFELRFTEELNIKQIADILMCPEGTVKSRLFYLIKELSKKLKIYKPEFN